MLVSQKLSIVVLSLLLLVTNSHAEESKEQPIVFGAIFPLTGAMAAIGQGAKRGLEIAVDQLNAKRTGPKIEIYYQDSVGEPAKAISGFNVLQTQITVPVIFSSLTSIAYALKTYADRNNVLLVVESTEPNLLSGTKNVVRNFVTSEKLVEEAGRYFSSKGYKNISLLRAEEEWAESATKLLKQLAVVEGFEIGAEEAVAKDTLDLKSTWLRLRTKNPDAEAVFIMLVGSIQSTAILEAEKLGLELPLATTYLCAQPSVLETTGSAYEGNVSFEGAISETSPQYQQYLQEYSSRFNSKFPEYNSLTMYDNLHLLVQAITDGASTPTEIKTTLINNPPYQGLAGTTKFNPTGDSILSARTLVINNGQCHPNQDTQ